MSSEISSVLLASSDFLESELEKSPDEWEAALSTLMARGPYRPDNPHFLALKTAYLQEIIGLVAVLPGDSRTGHISDLAWNRLKDLFKGTREAMNSQFKPHQAN